MIPILCFIFGILVACWLRLCDISETLQRIADAKENR